MENPGSSQCWYWSSPAEFCCPVISPRAKLPAFKSAFVLLALALATLGPDSPSLSQTLTPTAQESIPSKKTPLSKSPLKRSESTPTTGTFSKTLWPLCCSFLPVDPRNYPRALPAPASPTALASSTSGGRKPGPAGIALRLRSVVATPSITPALRSRPGAWAPAPVAPRPAERQRVELARARR